MLIAILALAVYTAMHQKPRKATSALSRCSTFHVLGAIGEIALVSAAYAAR
jgi:hypothetical protein